ncbi:MAG: S1 RNA-binding domain-containing protein [bacterium]|nr:S1 RNA-binding domain-containing protein [bacterium]
MIDQNPHSELAKLLETGEFLSVPNIGELVTGTVTSTKGREIRLDISGLTTGVVRGGELFSESDIYGSLKIGQKVEATVIELENEMGEMELSFRYAGRKKAWEDIKTAFDAGEKIKVKVLDANKGGLLIRAKHMTGFLPVSQLSPDHYPRVTGGDKGKILEKLQEYVGKSFEVMILDINEEDEKLIVSEKAVWEAEQKNVISQITISERVKGEITALADFGAFVKFAPENGDENAGLEGLVHISEIAWQRIDHPKQLLKIGQQVEAEIIGIEGSKIFLSMKKLVEDPWTKVSKKYNVGDVIEGTVLKINPFGFFVELDQDIHGLAHISEITNNPKEDLSKYGEVGKKREFKIVSIEANEHRLGLSIKALKGEDKNEDTKEEPAAEEAATETAAE